MDLSIISVVLDWVKDVAVQYQAHIGAAGTIIFALYSFWQKYKEIVGRIVLRIQKDTADGTFTNEEKEQCAVDIYFTEIIPVLPIYLVWLKVAPRFIVEPVIRKIVRAICKKTSELKKVTR